MRLLKIEPDNTLSLVERSGSDIPPYAILSHTWGKDEDEITFEDWNNGIAKSKAGYAKIHCCGEQAANDNLEYFWIDTLCIDKTSSAELSEAINSMYMWYEESAVCYAYLADVSSMKSFSDSRWFTRGWTLQELVAPEKVMFFDCTWKLLGSRVDLCKYISKCTQIPGTILTGFRHPDHFSIAQRMSWAARRHTKRIEDRAYSLLGIFGIGMGLLYGEGLQAFIRLQEEIMKSSEDTSLLAWRSTDNRGGCLATSPDAFIGSGRFQPWSCSDLSSDLMTTSSRGIHLDLPLIGDPRGGRMGFVVLNCRARQNELVAIRVRDTGVDMQRFERIHSHEIESLSPAMLNDSLFPVRKICLEKGRIGRIQRTRYSRESDSAPFQHTRPWDHLTPIQVFDSCNLLDAIANGREDAVWWYLVNQGTNVNAMDPSNKWSALSFAVVYGQRDMVRMFLSREDIDLNSRDEQPHTPLSWAASRGDEAMVKLLLGTGKVNMNLSEQSGRMPLVQAAENGYEAIIDLLLEALKIDLSKRVPEVTKSGHNRYNVNALRLLMSLLKAQSHLAHVW
jgi:hypothetical protein